MARAQHLDPQACIAYTLPKEPSPASEIAWSIKISKNSFCEESSIVGDFGKKPFNVWLGNG